MGPSKKGNAEVQCGVLVGVTACRWSALRESPAVPGLMVSGPKRPMARFPEEALWGGAVCMVWACVVSARTPPPPAFAPHHAQHCLSRVSSCGVCL